MARTVQQIVDSILIEKAKHGELNPLNSPSATSVWRRWVYITAMIIFYLETLFDDYKEEIKKIISNGIIGRGAWYVSKAYEFQYGDNLKVIDNIIGYEVIDTAKKIIKRASFSKGNNGSAAVLKVATTNDITSKIVALDNAQLLAFNDYIDNIMFVGTSLVVQSANTDLLKLYATIYYNPLFFVDTVKNNCIVAINNYLATIQFDGIVKASAIVDSIQKVAGVDDVVIDTIEAKTNTGNYAAVNRSYQTVAGYIEIDDVNFPLSTTLTMAVI